MHRFWHNAIARMHPICTPQNHSIKVKHYSQNPAHPAGVSGILASVAVCDNAPAPLYRPYWMKMCLSKSIFFFVVVLFIGHVL